MKNMVGPNIKKRTNSHFQKPILIMDVKTGKIKEFPSVKNTAVFLNITSSSVTIALNKKDRNVSTRGYILRYSDNDLPFPKLDQISTSNKCAHNVKGVSLMNVMTGEIQKFDSMTKAAIFLKITIQGLIRVVDKSHKNKPTRNGYLLRRDGDPTPWPTQNQIIKKSNPVPRKSSVTTTPILAMNAETREILKFYSLSEVAARLGISTSGISKALDKFGSSLRIPTRGYFLKRESDEIPWPTEEEVVSFAKNTSIEIMILDRITGEISRYKSANQAAKDLDCTLQTISRRARLRLPVKYKEYLVGTETAFRAYLTLSSEQQARHLKTC